MSLIQQHHFRLNEMVMLRNDENRNKGEVDRTTNTLTYHREQSRPDDATPLLRNCTKAFPAQPKPLRKERPELVSRRLRTSSLGEEAIVTAQTMLPQMG
jgi:hypothetical protein